ncbi:exportin-T [Thraustotheca clavata]|uniref:Exportin-T n=1 Tax=Thraustotheca clavata TaxID=74557 RepID=A0A1V9ZCD4_9STRA|nr:exportin-T [Thraustotheca clavata]
MTSTSINAAQLERAIVYAFEYADASNLDANALKIKSEAEGYCQLAKRASYTYFLQLFQTSTLEQVKFYSLQALQEYLNPRSPTPLNDTRVMHIRNELLQWIQTQGQLPTYLKTKLAVVITFLIRREYPENWPNAFQDLLTTLPSNPLMVEMYFRILIAIYEEIVEFDAQRTTVEANHNMKIKDAMREGPSACIAASFDVIYNILTAYQPQDNVSLNLALSALETLQKYISWVDITLVMRFVPLLFHALTNLNELRCKAANCLYEVVAKGMLPDKKLALFQTLDLIPILSGLQSELNDDSEFSEEVGEVVNGMGLELITCIDHFRQTQDGPRYEQASAMMTSLMPLTWFLFAHETTDVSQEVFELVNAMSSLLRVESSSDIFTPSVYLPQWLHGISRQIRYPEEDDEVDEAEFEDYRRQLLAIFVNIARLRPDVVLLYLGNLLSDALTQVQRSQISDRDLEACLCLLYRFKEGLTTIKGPHSYDDESAPLLQMVLAVHTTLLQLPHFSSLHYRPLIMYYELGVRYSALWRTHPELLALLLQHIFSSGGVGHVHPTLRSRSCYLILRLLKSLGTSVHPHMAQVLQAIEPHLVVQREETASSGLTWADQLYLFELTGFLIGSMPFQDLKLQYAQVVVAPQLQLLDQCLVQAPNEETEAHLAHILNAVGHLLKGFKGKNCMPQQNEVFSAVLATAARVLLAYQTSTLVRSKVIFTLHRMVNLLEPEVLCQRNDLLLVLMQHCDANDVIEVVQLLNQLVIQYKAVPAFVQLVEATVIPFFNHLGQLLANDPAPEDRATVQKHMYSYLMHLSQHALASVFVSPRNVSAFPQVLQLILDGFTLELHVVRASATILEHWIPIWFTKDECPPQRDVLEEFLLRDVVPAMFEVIQHQDLNIRDMQAHTTLKDIAKVQALLAQSSLNEAFLNTLQSYLMSVGVPAAMVQAYSEAVRSHDVAMIVNGYKALIQASRGSA